MKKIITLAAMLGFAAFASAQQLPAKWEELTGPDFKIALQKSEGVCVIPMGVLEKHGPHMPIGTDVFSAREVAKRATAQEYAVIFPFYYFGQVSEAQQQAGTMAYSPELIYKMLEETCAQIARNGMKKIILCNSHGGNSAFLEYFCQTQLYKQRDYVVYLFDKPDPSPEAAAKIDALRSSNTGGHADEIETSTLLVAKPGLMKMEAVDSQSGADMNRLDLPYLYTGIWWYAKYPNHYAGESSGANKELGEVKLADWSNQLVEAIKAVKADTTALKLQNEYFGEIQHPADTPLFGPVPAVRETRAK